MRLAFATGAIVGVLAPAVGFFLVQRRLSLIGDGIGHAAFAGVAAGYVLGHLAGADRRSRLPWPPPSRSSGCARAAPPRVTRRSRSSSIPGSQLGVVLVAQAGALDVDLFAFLFGSILTVTTGDLILVAVLGGLGLVALALLYRALAAVVLDEEGARVAGVPIGRLNVFVAVLAALTVALSMRVVGILLVAALMVLPVIAATRVAWSMASTVLLSVALGLASVLGGLTIAYYADLPPGGTIVLLAAGAFVAASGVAAARKA